MDAALEELVRNALQVNVGKVNLLRLWREVGTRVYLKMQSHLLERRFCFSLLNIGNIDGSRWKNLTE